MPSRPPVLAAKLQFYGEAADADFTARVLETKRREWNAAGVTVVAFDARGLRLNGTDCADYGASLIDRRGPDPALEQPSSVTIAGRACRHPDAPWLTVDVNATHRDTGGELRQAIDPAWDAFVRSVTLDAFQGPIVESVLLLGGAERPGPGPEADRVLIGGAVLGTAGVWVSHIPLPGAGLPVLSLSYIDDAFRRTEVEISVSGGAVRGVTGDSVWVSGGSMAVRVDAASHTAAPRFELLCSPWELSLRLPAADTHGRRLRRLAVVPNSWGRQT